MNSLNVTLTRSDWLYHEMHRQIGIRLYVAGWIAALGLAVVGGYTVGSSRAKADVEPAIIPEEPLPPPVVIKVDNVNCVIAEEPTLTYYVMTDTVRVSIECDSDILFNYLPALVEEGQEDGDDTGKES